MKLYIDGVEFCDVTVVDSKMRDYGQFGQAASIDRVEEAKLELSKALVVGLGDQRRFEVRDETRSRPISPLGATDRNGRIQALWDGPWRETGLAD